MSAVFEWALQTYAECRAAFEDYRLAQYDAALEACAGVLLSKEAQHAGVDSLSLFMGSRARAERWASEELRDWWAEHGRLSFAEFEADWLAGVMPA